MRRALGKPHLRLVGVDDGPFTRRHRRAPIVAVFLSTGGPVEAIRLGRASVDGDDATDAIARLLLDSPHLEGTKALLLDGISVAGFNLVDLDRLARALARPVISVTRQAPDFDRIRAALVTYFPRDLRRLWRLATRHRPFRITGAEGPLWIAAVGASRSSATQVVRRSIVVGNWPEPLRIARLVARASLAAGAPRSATAPRSRANP